MERCRRKLVKRRGSRADAYPLVWTEFLLEPCQSFVVVTRLRFDPYHKIVHPVIENIRDGSDDLMDWEVSGIDDGYYVLGYGEEATGPAAAELAMGDEVGRFLPLDVKKPILGISILCPAALVPRDGLPDRYQQSATGIHPVAELGIIHLAPPRERLVAPAYFPVKMLADPEVSPYHHPEYIIGLRRQVTSSRQMGFYPGRVRLPTRKQFF